MDRSKKIETILKEINEAYTVPSYMEKYVRQAIGKALTEIEKEEGKA